MYIPDELFAQELENQEEHFHSTNFPHFYFGYALCLHYEQIQVE